MAIAIISFTNPNRTRVRAQPTMAIVQGASALAYEVKDADYCLLVSASADWNGQMPQAINSNRYYYSTATLTNKNIALSVMVQRHSTNPGVVIIDGKNYRLADGSVFRVRAKAPLKPSDGAPTDNSNSPTGVSLPLPTKEVVQLPFAPLEVTPAYVDELNEYFLKRGL
ncbi:MAG TPA: hypothetical protein VGJ26_05570 [Pirellulales bacterium]